jgi:glycine betaine catabolism A
MPASRTRPTLTRLDYVAPEVFDLERRRIFHAGWFYVAHVAAVPAGSSRVFEVVGEQVIVTCDRDGEYYAFANTCRHRGAQLVDTTDPTLALPQSSAASIRCPYHAWTYGLDGQLMATPRVDRYEVNRDESGLWSYRADVWNGLLFVTLSPDVAPLADWLLATNAELIAFGHLRIAEMALIQRTISTACANWKIVVENYLECLHCPTVHPELVEVIPHYRSGAVVNAERSDGSVEFVTQSNSYASAATGCEALPLLPGVRDADKGVYNGAQVFPNLLFDVTASGLVLTALFPVAPDRTQLVSEYLFAPEVADSSTYDPTPDIAFNEMVGAQDIDVCERVQRGVASSAFATGILTSKDALVAAFNDHYRAALDVSERRVRIT